MAKGKYHYWLTEEGLTRLKGWATDGLTNEQIAENMGINPDTLYTWQNRFTEIAEALKKGKEIADREVENALYKRAIGMEYTETKQLIDTDGKKRVEKATKFIPPDSTAIIYWLKNRKPDIWRDRKETEITGKDGGPIEVSSPRKQIASRIDGIAARLGKGEDT